MLHCGIEFESKARGGCFKRTRRPPRRSPKSAFICKRVHNGSDKQGVKNEVEPMRNYD